MLSITIVGLWWGVGVLFLLPATPAQRALVFAFVMLMAGGHSASYAAHPATVTLGVLALTLPITVHFALQRDVFHGVMAISAVMYLAATFRSIRTLSYFFGRTHRLAHEVQLERDRAEQMARTDFLTQLNNRRAFYDLAEAALRHARRYDHPLALLMIDIDHFKAINDEFGHAAGDAALCTVAKLIREQYRVTDIAGRLGGEEFALLLPETGLPDALAVAERLRVSVGAHAVEHEGQVIRFTASIGVAALQTDETIDQLMLHADAELYRAKHAGRNSISPAHA
jgi:diguanylate cyclase (GGDEF)-like protein